MPAAVNEVFPANGSTGQTLRTCVALSLTEWPELATVDSSSCIVRPGVTAAGRIRWAFSSFGTPLP